MHRNFQKLSLSLSLSLSVHPTVNEYPVLLRAAKSQGGEVKELHLTSVTPFSGRAGPPTATSQTAIAQRLNQDNTPDPFSETHHWVTNFRG